MVITYLTRILQKIPECEKLISLILLAIANGKFEIQKQITEDKKLFSTDSYHFISQGQSKNLNLWLG